MTIADQFYKGIADAVTDIRQKVVEEAWFGRAVTQLETTAPQWPQARDAEQTPSAAQDREREQPDRDIDR